MPRHARPLVIDDSPVHIYFKVLLLQKEPQARTAVFPPFCAECFPTTIRTATNLAFCNRKNC